MAGILLNRSRQAPADETPAFGGIAERFRRAGDLDRAIALCRDGLKRFPNQLSARVTLGWALLDKGQFDEARSELEQVLRRAPDNLAAIRGLAELHDRSEGALPSMEERESWKQEEARDEAARASSHVTAQAPAASARVSAEAVDPFAPISVTLASSTADEAPPEILHTAQHAAEEAVASFEVGIGIEVEPVQLEDAATASMAAAAEPTPFFVGGEAAGETAGTPVDTHTGSALEPVELMAFQAEEIALDDSIDLQAFGLDDGGGSGIGFLPDVTEVTDAPGASAHTPTQDWVAPVAEFQLASEPGDEPADAATLSLDWPDSVSDSLAIATAPVAAPEALDELDADAAAELVETMRALEARESEGSTPFESTFAIDRPVEVLEEVQPYQGLVAEVAEAPALESMLADFETDGTPETEEFGAVLEMPAAEAATPLERASDHEQDAAPVASSWSDDVDELAAGDVHPAFAASAIGAMPVATVSFEDEAAPVATPASETPADIVFAAEGVGLDDIGHLDLAGPVALHDLPLEEPLPDYVPPSDVSVADDERPTFELIAAEVAALESMAFDEGDLDLVVPDIPASHATSMLLDYEPEPEVEVAAVVDEPEIVHEVYEPVAAAIAEVLLPEPTAEEVLAAQEVYRDDSLALVGGFDGAMAVPFISRIDPRETRRQATIVALERFLRKVQARRVELETESVA